VSFQARKDTAFPSTEHQDARAVEHTPDGVEPSSLERLARLVESQARILHDIEREVQALRVTAAERASERDMENTRAASEPRPAERVGYRSAKDDRPKDVGREFAPAFRALVTSISVARPDALFERIESITRERKTSLDIGETVIKVAFALLPDAIVGAPSAAPLQAFVDRLLGPGGRLIWPKAGDSFDTKIHQDCSSSMTGTRSKVHETRFPGVALNERVLTRALVVT
jgi:hypothetical protein